MIKQIKIGNKIYDDFEVNSFSEDGIETSNIPDDLNKFKQLAVDTINWQIGNNVKKALGNTQVNLSAVNSKAIALVVKILDAMDIDISKILSEKEQNSFSKLVTLSNSGYSDSDMLNNSLNAVMDGRIKGYGKAERVTKAKTHDEVIAILNEE